MKTLKKTVAAGAVGLGLIAVAAGGSTTFATWVAEAELAGTGTIQTGNLDVDAQMSDWTFSYGNREPEISRNLYDFTFIPGSYASAKITGSYEINGFKLDEVDINIDSPWNTDDTVEIDDEGNIVYNEEVTPFRVTLSPPALAPTGDTISDNRQNFERILTVTFERNEEPVEAEEYFADTSIPFPSITIQLRQQ